MRAFPLRVFRQEAAMFSRRLESYSPGLVQRVVKEAGASAGQEGFIDLGGERTFAVAEALVLKALFGPRFAATGGAWGGSARGLRDGGGRLRKGPRA